MTAPGSRPLVAPDDGSLGPVLRIADDRLAPGAGYGVHRHRAVDVVAVVVAGELRHRWGSGTLLRAGDVAVLRAGTGLEHDEVSGAGGARVVQTYLRSADPTGTPRHDVVRSAAGWVELGRPDARLWVGRAGPGRPAEVPAGLRVVLPDDGAALHGPSPAARVESAAPATVLVWVIDDARPAWALDEPGAV